MRFCSKLVFTLILAFTSLHYFCSSGRCSDQLIQICQYTSPIVWNRELRQHSLFYREKITPVVKVSEEYYKIHLEPTVKSVHGQIYEKISDTARKVYIDSGYHSKVKYYYTGILRPQIVSIFEKVRHYEPLQPLFTNINPFIEWLKVVLDNAKVIVVGELNELRLKYHELSGKTTSLITPSVNSNEYTTSASHSTVATSPSDLETDVQEETNEFEDVDDVTTSTIVKTVTVDTHMETGATFVPNVNQEIVGEDIAINEQTALQNEFEEWANSIEKKIESVTQLLEKDANKTTSNLIKKTEKSLREQAKEFTKLTELQFQNITKAVQDIDCKTEIDPQSGEKRYFNKEGTVELERYIDRPLMRDYFEEAKNQVAMKGNEMKNNLSEVMLKANEKVSRLREDYADMYEEWANVMVTEWSKRLAYVDVVAAHEDNDQDGSISEQNWKKFLKIKKDIIEGRQRLIDHIIDMDSMEKFMKKIEQTLTILVKEHGEYSYILRAKANLAFQKREKEERELLAKQKELEMEAKEHENKS